MMKDARVRLLALPALVIALALASGPAFADSQPAAVTRELEKARVFDSRRDQQNACKAYSRANELAGGKSSLSLIGVAHCYKQIKDGDKAVATARQALAVATTPEERTQATTTLGIALLEQPDEKSWGEAADLFKQQVASSNGAQGSTSLLSALLALHRDPEAAELLRSQRQHGQSTDNIQQILCNVYVGSRSDDAQRIDDRNARVRNLDPDAPMQVGGKVGRPEILHQTKPVMPAEAIQHPGGLRTVILQTVIDAQGRVRNLKVFKEQPYGLTESAVNAVKAWTFKPSTLDGEPVPACYVLEVNYRIG